MPKLWLILGIVSLLIGLFGYIDQEVRRHASWSWVQVGNHESAVGIAMSVGIALLAVAVAEYVRSRKTNGRDPSKRG